MLINIFTTVVPSVLRYLTHISYISIFHPEIYIHVDITFKTINGIIIYFLIFNCVKVPIYLGLGLITGETLRFDAKMIPAVIAGALLGRWIMGRISPKWFKVVVLGLAGLAALRLLW